MPGRQFQITIDATGETFSCRDDQHLLSGMASMGKRGIPSGCHGGGCGVCKIEIMQGRIRTLPMSRQHVSAQEQAGGIVLACRVFPQTSLRLKVMGTLANKILQPQGQRKFGFV